MAPNQRDTLLSSPSPPPRLPTLAPPPEQPSPASELAWQALQEGGAVALRHAHAPGTGDPPEFRLGDCSTQRNLSSKGREQARRIGEQFQANHTRSSGCCPANGAAASRQPGSRSGIVLSRFRRSTRSSQSKMSKGRKPVRFGRLLRDGVLIRRAGAGHPPGEHHGVDRHLPSRG